MRFPPEWVTTWYQRRVSFRWDPQRAVEGMSGCVSGEIAEMAGLNRVDTEDVKNFVENKAEKNVRLAYRHDPEDFARAWHLVGTSNRITDGLLPDVDGLRRFWPVDVGYSDYQQVKKWLDENRDQIWAQALAEWPGCPRLYRAGGGTLQISRRRLRRRWTGTGRRPREFSLLRT